MRAKARVNDLLSFLKQTGRVTVRGALLWPASLAPGAFEAVRGPTEDGWTRSLEQIPPEEIANAMRRILVDNLALDRIDLPRETARLLLGVDRLGRNMSEGLAPGIALLASQGIAVQEGDRVRWVERRAE